MKLSEAKFCVEPDCEELAHRSVQLCPCGSAQFFDLSYLADPEAHRFKRLERRRARQLRVAARPETSKKEYSR